MDDDLRLFDLPPADESHRKFVTPSYPMHTKQKANLIADYLRFFLYITKHGIYLDAFAGPQDIAHPDLWAARKAIELEPPWLSEFHLFEIDPRKLELLEELRQKHPGRQIHIHEGDFNTLMPGLLETGAIAEKRATFCLLDQRTFECDWASVVRLATHRAEGFKLELFYFLAQGWLDRAVAGSTTPDGRERIERWWGSSEWETLVNARPVDRARLMSRRFIDELGYASARPYPIYGHGTRIMYYMIHATDHHEAPKQMNRAYLQSSRPLIEAEELQLWD